MSVDITYRCNGCEDVAVVTGVKAERVVLTPNVFMRNGVAYDKTRVERPSIESSAPVGWMVWDPYTQMTYCPACWASIEEPWRCEGCGATTGRYDNGDACEKCVMASYAEMG